MLDTELVRYNEARKYYMERENLFDPQGVVPAVSKEENNILGQIEEGNNDELSGTMQIEDKGIGELEQKKKNELINSIRDSQQELEQLKQRLECRGISLDD